MDKKELREDARSYFLPIILGSNARSHSLSLKIFAKYQIAPIIADTKKSIWRFLDPFCSFLPLASSDPELTAEQLTAFAQSDSYTLPILIPCSEDYEKFILSSCDTLEKIFVIRSCDDVLSSSPLSDID